ncbi:MAG: hypothetical protein H0W86_06755 [Armatimonadetes bacterium]|nr:hypothetical protein [Armatimonadota bacterium]
MNDDDLVLILPDSQIAHLPLAFRKIQVKQVPTLAIEEDILFENDKFKFTAAPQASKKPISKILK